MPAKLLCMFYGSLYIDNHSSLHVLKIQLALTLNLDIFAFYDFSDIILILILYNFKAK